MPCQHSDTQKRHPAVGPDVAPLKGVPLMANQRPDQYSIARFRAGDDVVGTAWKGPGCTDLCQRIRVLVIGEVATRYIVVCDALSHEEYGMGLDGPGAHFGKTWTVDP